MSTRWAHGTDNQVLELISSSTGITSTEIADELGLSPHSVRIILRALRRRGLIRVSTTSSADHRFQIWESVSEFELEVRELEAA